MSQPALKVIDGGDTETVALTEYERLHRDLEEMAGELAATRRAHSSEHRRAERLKNELEEKQAKEIAKTGATVTTILRYWANVTGREKYRIVLSGINAQLVRWLLAQGFEPREVCLMALGMAADQWHRERGLTDWKFICTTKVDGKRLRDEEKARKFMDAGAALAALREAAA